MNMTTNTSRPATDAGIAQHRQLTETLPFADEQDFEDAHRGFIAALSPIGIRTFKIDQAVMVWRTGSKQAVSMTVTFILTMLVPMQYAVLAGVGISVILFVARQSNLLRVVRWELDDHGAPLETDPPDTLAGGDVVVLTTYGSLFFASASVFAGQLPVATDESKGSVVILRLRGKEDLGSTCIRTITGYHDSLQAVGAHLILVSVGERVLTELRNTGAMDHLGEDTVFAPAARMGESLQAGLQRAAQLQDPHRGTKESQ